MSIRARIIFAALAVVAAVTVATVVYSVDREREMAVTRLSSTIREDLRLLQVVTAGPLYDGNITQLNAILESLFANRDILSIQLRENRGNISLGKARDADSQGGERIERQVRVVRGVDELGTIRVVYTTANIEQRLTQSRNTVVLFSLVLMGILSLVIYVLASRLTRPIEQLTRAAREIAAGDLARDIDARGAQELEILGQSFIQMRDAVREKIADLAEKNRQLRQQIEERIRTEIALRASEERFAKLFHEAPELMTLVRSADGCYLDVNNEFEKQTGFRRSETIGRTAMDLGLWQSTELRDAMLQALRRDGRVEEWEYRLRRRDGTLRDALLDAVTVDLDGETCWLFIIRDVTEQKAAQEMRALLAAVVESSSDAIIVSRPAMDIVSWNTGAERMFGWSAAEAVGREHSMIVPPELRNEPQRNTEILAEGRPVPTFETSRITKHGHRLDVQVSLSGIYDAAGRLRLVAGIFRDITERKLAETALRESEHRFRALVELSSDWYWQTDTAHRFTFREGEVLRRMGMEPEADYGKTRWDLGFLKPSGAEWDAHRAALERHEEFRDLLTARRGGNGRVYWATISGKPLYDGAGAFIGYQGTGRDITAQIEAETALRQSEAKISEAYAMLDDAIESAPAAIAVYDADDRLIAFNSRFRAFFAFEPDLVRPGVEFATLIRRFTESGQVARPRRAGPGWLDSRARAHRDPAGPIEMELTDGRWLQITETRTRSRGVVTVYNDITELKAREAELRRLNEELERKVNERTAELAAANTELEAFVYSVSHDLRAPLRGIDGFSHVLAAQYGANLDAEARQLLERVRAAAQRMGRLIADLLELSRLARSTVRRTDVSLSELAQSVVDELAAEAGTRTVEWHIEPDMKVRGDPGLLRVALANLLGNALKYTRDVSPARIDVGTAGRRDHLVEFFVRDNGAGFDMNYAARLFQPFQRLHAQHEFEGTGIGLATVQRVIAKHGGQIRGEGRPGGGATFYFTLPV